MERESTEAELRGLVQRARQGDPTVLPALREMLDARPGLWQQAGDLAAIAVGAWIDLAAGKDLLLREGLERKVAALREELAGPVPTPLEALLAERVVACWLQAAYGDAAYAQLKDAEATTAAARKEAMARQESAARRFLAAAKALALVRRLLVPAEAAGRQGRAASAQVKGVVWPPDAAAD